jgi:hypothetical protein
MVLASVVLTTAALADGSSVRLGANFRDIAGYPLSEFGTIDNALVRLRLTVQAFVKNTEDCADLVSIRSGAEKGYDKTRNTYAIIQKIKVKCWIVGQIERGSLIVPTLPTDGITPDVIWGIMANAERLSAESDRWKKTLTTFSGGDIHCKDSERCTLTASPQSDSAADSLDFELVLVRGDERFIIVTQAYEGRAGLIYGVQWRDSVTGGEVASIFPRFD